MNKDNFEGTVRSTVGKAEKGAGELFQDKSTTAQGRYDQAAGKVQSAVGSAKDAISSGVDAVASGDMSALRDNVGKLGRSVTDAVQKQTGAARDQVMGAVTAAGDNLSQATSAAQDNLASFETELSGRIQRNPWTAVAIAALVGLLVGKMS